MEGGGRARACGWSWACFFVFVFRAGEKGKLESVCLIGSHTGARATDGRLNYVYSGREEYPSV